MSDARADSPRQRNTILQGIELFQSYGRRRSIAFIIFLYVSENEGLTITELASLVRKTVSTCARVAIDLSGEGQPEAKSLIEFSYSNDDQRLKHIWLTPLGRHLRAELDTLIRSGFPISLDHTAARRAS